MTAASSSDPWVHIHLCMWVSPSDRQAACMCACPAVLQSPLSESQQWGNQASSKVCGQSMPHGYALHAGTACKLHCAVCVGQGQTVQHVLPWLSFRFYGSMQDKRGWLRFLLQCLYLCPIIRAPFEHHSLSLSTLYFCLSLAHTYTYTGIYGPGVTQHSLLSHASLLPTPCTTHIKHKH